MNRSLQEHTVRLEVYIKQVNFIIAYPARLNFSILIDGKIVSEGRKMHTMDSESYPPFQRHNAEIVVEYDTKKGAYRVKDVAIVMNYEPSRGRSGNRTIKFDPFAKENQGKQFVLPSESSKDFRIVFTSSFELLAKKAKQPTTSILDDPYSFITAKKESNLEKKSSVINDLVKTDSGNNSKKASQVNGYERSTFADKTKKLENVKSIPIESKKHLPKARMFSPRYGQESNQTTKVNEEMEKLRKKIEIERQEKVRSISKLKMEINSNFLGQLERKDKDEDGEISKMKEKIRYHERKQKSYLLNIDQLNAQLEKKRNKIVQLEKTRQELEGALGERENKFKSSQTTIKTLNQQLQSISSKERVMSRKGEVKEVVLKDQVKKLQQKLKSVEIQVIKVNQQKNSIIKSLSEVQKVHQAALKEKDTRINQQRAKLFKLKQENMEKEKQFTIQIQSLNERVSKVVGENNQLTQRISTYQSTILTYETEISALKETLKKIREENEKRLDDQLFKLTNDLNNMRLKYNELTSEANQLKEKVKRLESTRTENELRIRELQDIVKLKTNEVSKNIGRINALKQESQSLSEQSLRKSKEIQNLRQSCANLKAKWMQTKDKAEQEKSRRQQANSHLERQLTQFSKQRQSLQAEIKQLRWVIIRNNDNLSQLEYDLKEVNNSNLKLNEEIMSKTQRISSLEENMRALQLENDHYFTERNASLIKIKELTEVVKIRTAEFDDERKTRTKGEQKLEQERQRAKQYLNISKQRQTQDQKRQRQRQLYFIKKQQEIEVLQTQITKRKQEIISLKSSNELILREIQLSKMDNDNLKSEYHLLQANFKTIRQQNHNLIQNIETLIHNLRTNEENNSSLHKKYQNLMREYNDYKESIEKSLENLLVQLFKDESNTSNIIAASLLPFPSQTLSNLQIQLVQKRNSFIIKYRQRASDLQNQVNLLENQVKSLKEMYQMHEEESKKFDSEEREKLKGHLYENMLEKNNIVEELILQRKEREEMERQVERLKGEIYKKDEIEQELNGQLQLLLLEYDGIKSENQDLNNIIFKYKEADIVNKSQYDQKLLNIQEETGSKIEKLKGQAFERQRKIIQLQKDIIDLNQKVRRQVTEKLKMSESLQILGEECKIANEKIANLQVQITKLNNTIKNLQKKEGNCRDAIQKLQGEYAQQINKADILQSTINRLSNEHFQERIEKERIMSELANTKEKYSELEKLLYEKGESLKVKIEKKMEENSQLKSNLIKLTSQMELRQFYLKQKEQNSSLINEENQELKKSIAMLKARVKELVNKTDEDDTKIKELTRQIEYMTQERDNKQDKISQANFIIHSLQQEIQEVNKLSEILQLKEKECIQLRQSKSQSQEYYIGQLKKTKEAISQLKKQLKNQQYNFNNLEQQYRKSLQSSSRSNNQKYKYLQSEFLQQKDEFSKRVLEIQTHNKRVISEFQFRIEKLREDLEQSKDNERIMAEQASKKEQMLRGQAKKIEQLQSQLEDYKQKYNRYYQLYQENRHQPEPSTRYIKMT